MPSSTPPDRLHRFFPMPREQAFANLSNQYFRNAAMLEVLVDLSGLSRFVGRPSSLLLSHNN